MPDMTSEQFQIKMIQDPDFFLGYVLRNNLAGVNKNLVAAGMTPAPTDLDSAFRILQTLWGQGKLDSVCSIINVPFKTDATNGTEDFTPEIQDLWIRLNPNATDIQDQEINMGELFRLCQGENVMKIFNTTPMEQDTPTTPTTSTNSSMTAEQAHKLKMIIEAFVMGGLVVGMIWIIIHAGGKK